MLYLPVALKSPGCHYDISQWHCDCGLLTGSAISFTCTIVSNRHCYIFQWHLNLHTVTLIFSISLQALYTPWQLYICLAMHDPYRQLNIYHKHYSSFQMDPLIGKNKHRLLQNQIYYCTCQRTAFFKCGWND